MLKSGILNPQLNSLLARVRHTNSLVIADRGFPFWPGVETVDLTLVDDVPTVLQVLAAIRQNFVIGSARMAEEFLTHNPRDTVIRFEQALDGIALEFESHESVFKSRVPGAVGLVRTADVTPWANVILTSV
jgi:D-ribose pyranase